MNIGPKWLRCLFALLMVTSVGMIAGCADEGGDSTEPAGESLDSVDAGSDNIGGGGVDTP